MDRLSPSDLWGTPQRAIGGHLEPYSVNFFREKYPDGTRSPLVAGLDLPESMMVPAIPDIEVDQFIHRGRKDADSEAVWRALNALVSLAGLSGRPLMEGVEAFVARFGPLHDSPDELPVIHHRAQLPSVIARYYFDSPLPTPRHEYPMIREGMLLWSYHHEANELKKTIDLYRAIERNDAAAVQRAIVQCERLWMRDVVARFQMQPDEWMLTGWTRLAARLQDYMGLLRIALVEAHEFLPQQDTPARPLFIRQRLVARTPLGLIYGQVLQLASGHRAVRVCGRCEQLFPPHDHRQRFCSKRCAGAARTARHRNRRSTAT